MTVKLNLNEEQKNTIKPLLNKWQNANPIIKQIINDINKEELEAKYCGSISAILLKEAYYNVANQTRFKQLMELNDYIKDKVFHEKALELIQARRNK